MTTRANSIADKTSVSGKKWICKEYKTSEIENVMNKFRLSKMQASILLNRSVYLDQIENFLRPTFKSLFPDPNSLQNMGSVSNIIVSSIIKKKKIGIIGDYDVDGATSAALLYNYFLAIGIEATVFIPDRVKDGYGVKKNAIDFFLKKNIKIIITLDCGSNDHEALKYAEKKNIEVVIIDHHEIKEKEESLSIINPKSKDDTSGLDFLCAAGISFLFLVSINSILRNKNFFEKIKAPNLKNFLDLVAIGTVCDLVPLRKVNRLFVKAGLEILNTNVNLGIDVLSQKLGLSKKISNVDLAFYIGPCINSAGRLGEPKLGFELLTIKNRNTLSDIADRLIVLNNTRKTLQKLSMEKIIYSHNSQKRLNKVESNFIIEVSETFHKGIIGILASKLVDEKRKPSIVIAINDLEGYGSIRSVEGMSVTQLIDKLLSLKIIKSGGGHEMAGGFNIATKNISELKDYILQNGNIFFKSKNPFSKVDYIMDTTSIGIEDFKSIEQLAPFGMGNPEPLFLLKNLKINYYKTIGKDNNHIMCTLEDQFGKKIQSVLFNAANKKLGQAIKNSNIFDAIGTFNRNNWQGKVFLQFEIKDLISV